MCNRLKFMDETPPRRKTGRPKGCKNKITRQLKEIVLEALDQAGGADYLVRVAKANPAVFCQLLQKIIPTDITAVVESKSIDFAENDLMLEEALRVARMGAQPVSLLDPSKH